MKRLLPLSIIVLLLSGVLSSVALAQGPGPPDKDTFFPGSNDGSDLQVISSSLPAACTDYAVTYLQWDLSYVPSGATVNSASLTLTTTSVVSGVSGSVTFELLEVASDSWTETDSVAPGYGSVIESQTVSLANSTAGQNVVFNSTGLASYMENQLGGSDDQASIAVRISADCGLTTLVTFEDSESGADGPQLLLDTTPTAVTLTSFDASSAASIAAPWDQPLSWIAVLSLLTLCTVGLAVRRWRV